MAGWRLEEDMMRALITLICLSACAIAPPDQAAY
jgi:hypothetical protein